MREVLLALGVIVVAVGLAGCIGNDDAPAEPAAANASAGFTPCEHPWPCADGSEWPTNLTAPDEHPRRPAVIPETVGIEDGEVVEHNAKNATFRWTVPTADTATRLAEDGDTRSTHATTLTAPSGLFLEWAVELTVEDPGELDARRVSVSLEDPDGEAICTASTDDITLLDPGDQASCTSGTVSPLDEAAEWSLTAVHEGADDGTGGVDVTVTARVVEPRMTIGLETVEHTYVESHDGTRLEGWIFHPDLPEGVHAPVVLEATPYIGTCDPGKDAFVAYWYGCGSLPGESWVRETWIGPLVSHGYAVAVFSARGTGGSEGCFGWQSLEEQRDYAYLVDWLGERNWSNGRVGMYGLSYAGTTPLSAAIHEPDHLKTIVPAGIISDFYTTHATPQGHLHPWFGWREAKYDTMVSMTRPVQAVQTDQEPSYATIAAERVCEEHAENSAAWSSWVATDRRPGSYFDERRLVDHFDNVTSSVFVVQGFQDAYGSDHADQEDYVWATLERSPKRMMLGQWGHTFPTDDEGLAGAPGGDDWSLDVLVPWLDFWLKGLGDPEDLRLGTVDYEDTGGEWRETTSWPPAERTRQALYLAGDRLSAEPGNRSTSLRLAPTVRCQDPGATWAAFVGPSIEAPVTLAGNPFVYLNLSADQPGGVFQVHLLDAGPDVETCEDLSAGNVDEITRGGVDLRYHEGNFESRDFPTGEPAPVRVDLFNQAWRLQPGHRLTLLVEADNPQWDWNTHRPEITIHPDSHVVVPTVEANYGGELPDVDYPPRPFLPGDRGPRGPPR